MFPLLTLVTVTLATHYASAQTSLYIPGFDPQPVTANEIGVGADGETTWLLAPGVSSGTLQDIAFFGSATLIAGPSAAEVIYDNPSIGVDADEKCVINGDGTADCTAVLVSGTFTSTAFVTETVAPFEIQGGGLASDGGSSAPAPSAGSSPSSGASQSSTGAAQTSSGASQSAANASKTPAPSGSSQESSSSGSSSGTSTSPAPSSNGVGKLGWSVVAAWVWAAGATMLWFV